MKYTLIEKFLVQGVGFVQGLLLARLLSPEDFGLAAMLGIFLSVGLGLAEAGLGAAYVVYGGNSRQVLKWNLGIAFGLYAILALAAPAIADFYEQPILKSLTWAMGVGIILNAACVSRNAALQRARRFRDLSIANSTAVVAAFLGGVTLAFLGAGVWTIAAVGLIAASVRLLVLNVFHLDPGDEVETRDLRRLLSYGWKMTLSSIVHTIYLNAYQLVIGKILTPMSVGLFHRGQRWAALPVDVINESVARVSLPNLAANLVSARRYLLINAILLWPCLMVLWIFASEIVGLVLGEAWLACVPYMRIMIFGVFFTPLTNISLNYLRAKGRADLILVTDGVKKPLQITALIIGAAFGIVGLCWAKVVSDIVEASVDFVFAWRLRRRLEAAWFNLVRLRDTCVGLRLSKCHEDRAFDRLLEGKSIAVVGNGPSEVGKGLGAEIDSHDLVIRINNFKVSGFSADYGSRCDVWMKGGAADVGHDFPLKDQSSGLKAVLYTEDIVNEGMLGQNADWPKREMEAGLIVDYLDKGERATLMAKLDCRPSSGAFLIDRLRRIKGVMVDVYGFAFLDERQVDASNGFEHYAKDSTPENARYQMLSAGHDIVAESAYLKSLFNGRRLKCTI